MANYSQLKQSVKNVIKQNGQQEITGDVLQSVLISMITNLGMGDLYAGLAIPSTNPGTPDSNVFYIAVQQGTYANFGGLTVGANDGLTILAYNGTWTKTATGTAMKTDITTLQGTINSLSSTLQTVKSDLDTAERSITTLQGRTIPLSVSFDIDKIDALTDSSDSEAIKEAFTPLSGIGVAPVAGNILRSGNVIKNSQEVTVIWSDYDSKTAYYSFSYVIDNVLKIFQTDAKTFVRVAKTIVGGDVGAEIEDLQDRVSIGKAPVWITMTLESEPHDPIDDNIGDIIFFKGGNYLKEVVRSATGGKTLGPAVDMETGRLYVCGGNLCKWKDGVFVPFYLDDINTLKSKARYEYNLQKIFALSSYSESEDIEEAFTPTYAPDGNTAMRLPQSGDLLEATNGATSVVLKGTSSAFSFFYGDNRRDITLSGSAGNYKVMVEVTPMDVRVFDLDKLNALTDESTPEDIEEAFRGNYPTAGDLLRGADESSWVIMSGSETSTLARTFTYHTSGKLRTLTVSGDQGNETIKVEEKEVESGGALRITTSKISVLVSGGSGSYDLGVTFQQLQDAIADNQLIMGDINGELYAAVDGNSNVTLMSVAFLSGKWHSVIIAIPSYSGTTASVTVTVKPLMDFVTIPYSFLSGEIGGTYDNVKMSDLLKANIIQTDKGVATLDTTSGYVLSLLVDGKDYVRCTIDFSDSGGLKLTARTVIPINGVVKLTAALAEGQSVDIGMTLEEFAEKTPSFVIDSDGMLFYCTFYDASNIILVSLLLKENDKNSIGFSNIIVITDAGSGKVNISVSGYSAIVPKLGSDGKLPADVMPDNFIAGTGVTAIQTVTELPQSPDSGTLYLIMPSETTTSEEQL